MQHEPTAFAAVIGIDWADRKHDFVLQAPGSKKREKGILEHRPPAIAAWAEKLRERFAGAPISVAVALTRGPPASAPLDHSTFVLLPGNPSMLA